MRALLALAAFALATACAPAAHALNCMPIVGCTCNVVASDITFDDFNPLIPGPQTAIGDVSVTCSGVASFGGSVTVEISQGQWGTYGARKLRSPAGDTIDYNIYTSSAYNQVWGAGAQAVQITTGITLLQTWTVHRDMHARIIANPGMKPGDYGDNLVVRIIW